MPGPLGEATLGAARTAFLNGMHTVAIVTAAVMAAAAVVSALLLRTAAPKPLPQLDHADSTGRATATMR
jgi:hypothetical protein